MNENNAIAEAKAALDADARQRVEAANAALTEILARYNCELVVLPQLTADGRITAIVQIAAK